MQVSEWDGEGWREEEGKGRDPARPPVTGGGRQRKRCTALCCQITSASGHREGLCYHLRDPEEGRMS